MTTFYHVASNKYKTGEDLLSLVELVNSGINVEYKWGMDYEQYLDSLDADVVCLFDNIDDAMAFQTRYGGKLLKIELPEWAEEEGIRTCKVDEGYTAIFDQIPFSLCGEQIIFEVG